MVTVAFIADISLNSHCFTVAILQYLGMLYVVPAMSDISNLLYDTWMI